MADKARKATDKELVRLENKIAKIYKQSQKELREQWAVYMEQSAVQIIEQQKAYDNALKTNDSKKIKKAKDALADAKFKQTVFNEHYRDMIDQVTTKFAQVNKIALAYINDKMPKIYAINRNAIAPTADSLGIDFTIVNEHAVRNLIKSGDIKLPHKELDVAKDKRWNTKKLNSSVLQGIIQGNSMDEIADRILPVVDNNKNAAIRNARTMVTGAENQGKLDSFFELQEMGTVVRKKWIAVPDERTRTWHLVMDGQEQELKDKFVDGNGNRLMFPADPTSKPETVYNCRCGMEAVIIGFKDSNGNINYVDRSLHEDTGHHAKVQEEIGKREQITPSKNENANAVKEALLRIEIADRVLDYERGAVVSKTGEILARYDGTEHAVEVSDDDLKMMEDAIFTHNHPNGGFFSDNDIITGFTKTNLYELRASTPQGITYVLRNNGVSIEDARGFIAEYKQTSMKSLRMSKEHYIRMIRAGQLTEEEYNRRYYQLYMEYRDKMLIKMAEKNAEKYNFIFEVQHEK
jgi:hypothetical protein